MQTYWNLSTNTRLSISWQCLGNLWHKSNYCGAWGYRWRELPQVSFLSRQNTSFVATKVCLLQQKYVCHDKIFLSWQNFGHDKCLSRQTVLLWQKFCPDKHTFVASNTYLSWQKTSFVATIHLFCHNKSMLVTTKLLLWQKWYSWQLLLMIRGKDAGKQSLECASFYSLHCHPPLPPYTHPLLLLGLKHRLPIPSSLFLIEHNIDGVQAISHHITDIVLRAIAHENIQFRNTHYVYGIWLQRQVWDKILTVELKYICARMSDNVSLTLNI